jgi:hypothetical protein
MQSDTAAYRVLAGLDALVAGLRSAREWPDMVQHLERTRRQVARLLEMRGTGSLPQADEPSAAGEGSLDFKQVQEKLAGIADEAARAEEVDPEVAEYLRTTHLRLVRLYRAQHSEQRRLASRYAEDTPAEMVRTDGSSEPVRIRNRSALGFGVESQGPVEVDEWVKLVVDDGDGLEAHECLAIYCHELEHGYRLGLDWVGHLD